MSTRLQMRTAVQKRLGNRTDVTQADLDKWLDDALVDLTTRRVHIDELETVAPITTGIEVGVYSYPTSTTFAILYITDTTSGRILNQWDGTYESFLQANLAHEDAPTDVATHHIEFGGKINLFPRPQDIRVLVVYFYSLPTMGAGDSAEPNINPEWHYPIEILAAKHGHHDLGDDVRADKEEQRWAEWLSQRDSSRRLRTRFNVPTKGIGLSPAARNRRTGV